MLSKRLIEMIEDHAAELTSRTLNDLRTSPRTPSYHALSTDQLHSRVYSVYRDLGNWLAEKTDAKIETWYRGLGERRCNEGVALSELIYALILTKKNLEGYVRNAGISDSAVELYRERELFHMLDYFFDRAMYYAAVGYEREAEARAVGAGARTVVAGAGAF